jgi:ABC-type nitrate/sulfonate/bicarbonate transport system substrate-binding protein
MHVSSLKKTAAAALLSATLLTGGAPAKAETESAVLALPAVAIVFLSAYVAEDAHLWEKEGLNVKIQFVAGVGAFNAVVSGSADFSMSSGLTLNRAAAHGQRMVAIANTIDRLPMNVVIRKDIADAIRFDPNAPLAARAQALKGRTMAVDTINSIVHAYLRVIGKAAGLDPESIQVTPMQPGDMLAAMDRKAIDGFSNGPPWPQKVLTEGKAVLVASGANGDPPGVNPLAFNVVVSRPQYCDQHRSICTKMGHSMVEAAKFIHDHPDETMGFLKRRFPDVGEAALKSAFDEVQRATPLEPLVDQKGLASADRLNIEAGLMKPDDKVQSYDGLYIDQYAR